MKRFFLIALAVCIVASCMVVPAFATEIEEPAVVSETESYYVSGPWYFNATVSGSVPDQSVNFTCDGTSYISMQHGYTDGQWWNWYRYGSSYSNRTKIYNTETNTWVDEKYRSIDFGDVAQSVSSNFYTWLTSNAVYTGVACDGSSCPTTDANCDSYCDICGKKIRLLETNMDYEIIVKQSDSLTVAYRFFETVNGTSFDALYSNGVITVTFDNTVGYQQFVLVDGVWEDNTSYLTKSGSVEINYSPTSTMVSSSIDIYDESGELFFPPPRTLTVAIQEGLGKMQVTLSRTALILVLCGVGCLVSLIGLNLLPKVFYRFLS